jgi:hypothetical protein
MAESTPTQSHIELRELMTEKHPGNEFDRIIDFRASFLGSGPSFGSVIQNINDHLDHTRTIANQEV